MKFPLRITSRLLVVFGLLLTNRAGLAMETQATVSEPDTNNLLPIDLPTTLRLAGAQNLDVQLAREKLAEAEAMYRAMGAPDPAERLAQEIGC